MWDSGRQPRWLHVASPRCSPAAPRRPSLRGAPAKARGAEEAQRVELQHTLPKVNHQRHALVVRGAVFAHSANHGLRAGRGQRRTGRLAAGQRFSTAQAMCAPPGCTATLPCCWPACLWCLQVPHQHERVAGRRRLARHARQRVGIHVHVARRVGQQHPHQHLRQGWQWVWRHEPGLRGACSMRAAAQLQPSNYPTQRPCCLHTGEAHMIDLPGA